jgi:hypothetical protein
MILCVNIEGAGPVPFVVCDCPGCGRPVESDGYAFAGEQVEARGVITPLADAGPAIGVYVLHRVRFACAGCRDRAASEAGLTPRRRIAVWPIGECWAYLVSLPATGA